MKKIFLFGLILTIGYLSSCKDDTQTPTPTETPKKTALISKETETSAGKVLHEITYEQDSSRRVIKETYKAPTFSDICNISYGTNKMFLKCDPDVDYEYIIANNLTIQRLDKINNLRFDSEYDGQKLFKATRYDKNNKAIRTTLWVYNSEGNLTDEVISGDVIDATQYEYDSISKTITAIQEVNYGYIYFGTSSKNPPSRRIQKDNTGKVYKDEKLTYVVNSTGLITQKIIKNNLNPNDSNRIITYTYK